MRQSRSRGGALRNLIHAVVTALAVAFATAPTAMGALSLKDRYVAVLHDGVNVQAVVRDHTRLGADVSLVYRHALDGYAARLSAAELAAVRRDARVDYVLGDRQVEPFEQQTPTGVQRIGGPIPEAPGPVGAVQATRVGVAVIDSGIDLDHPDLGTVIPGRNCIGGRPLPDDGYGHGTHVAGTIAALDNGVGVVGVAPGTPLYAVKVFDNTGFGTYSALLCAVDWVTAHAAVIRVANMSLGWRSRAAPSRADCSNAYRDALHTAVCRSTKLGTTYVVAAGNAAADASGYLPAAYEEVITVSALSDSDGAPGGLGLALSCQPTERDDFFASFSNWGTPVDIAAPGVCILSTTKDGGYDVRTGTSMAAPHVAGAAALYLQSHPLATPAEVRANLIAAEEPGPIAGDPDGIGEGVVRVSSVGSGLPPLPTLPEVPALPPPPTPEPPAIPPLPPLP